MDYFLGLDWAGIFAPELTLPEVLVRGTVVYLALLLLLRVIPKWQAGPGSIASMLFVVLLGGLAADAAKGPTESVTDHLLMIATVMMWVLLVDRLSYRSRWFRSLAQDSPTCLIRDGRLLRANLRREHITEEDLKTQLRRQDVDDVGDVLTAHLEADGSISVVRKEEDGPPGASGSTSPSDACDAPDAAGAGAAAGAPEEDPSSAGGPPDGDDPELGDFLAAAERLQLRLEWHQEQVARFKEALTRHGVRVRPFTTARRDEGDPEEDDSAS